MIAINTAVTAPTLGDAIAASAEALPVEYYVIDVPAGADDLGLETSPEALSEPAAQEVELTEPHEDADGGESTETEPQWDESVQAWVVPEQPTVDSEHANQPSEEAPREAHEAQPNDLAHPEDFWTEVVRVQQQFAARPEFTGRALEAAIAWVAAGASGHALASSAPGHGLRHASTQGAQEPRIAAPSLEQRAAQALVVAHQQRGSALRAAGGGRG